MIKRIVLIVVLSSLLLLAACASGGDESFASEEAIYYDDVVGEAASLEPRSDNMNSDTIQTTFQSVQSQERLIIREGNMNVVVEDTDLTLAEIGRLAEGKGGWVVSSDVYDGGGAKSGSITIRIPVEQFESTMAAIRNNSVEVRSESTSSQDVTEEYVDLDARVANLEATADRVRLFLDESRNVEEALEVNRELSRLEGDIESLKARMKYLSQSAAFSLLVIHLTPDALSQPIEIGGWQPEGVARDAFETLISALEGLGTVAIWGGIFCLPILLLFGIPLYFIGRTILRRRRANDQDEDVAEDISEQPAQASELEE